MVEGWRKTVTGDAPIFSVSYPQNEYFTGREELVADLAKQLAAGGRAALGQVAPAKLPNLSRAAISGLGGIGKTQTAVEFAYRHREEYRAVFFVRADPEGELLGGFAAMAQRLGLPEAAGQDQPAAAQAARAWLAANDGWLLILDELNAPLLRFSLVERDPEGRTFSMHRLVQQVVRQGLGEARGDMQKRVVKALRRRAFSWPEFVTWPRCERLLAHFFAIARVAEESEELAWLLNAAGSYLDDRARYIEAEPLYVRSLAIREKVLGAEHPDVASSLNLAELYRNQGRRAEAEPLYLRSLAILEKVLGPEHPVVATSLNNLAILYRRQGRLAEAEPLYLRSLAIREKALGDSHPLVAQSLENYANLLRDIGREAEAAELEQRAREVRARHEARNRPDV